MRRDSPQRLALQQRLAHQAKLEIFEIAKAAVDQLGRRAGGGGSQVAFFSKENGPAASGGVARDATTVDAAADHGEVVDGFVCSAPDGAHAWRPPRNAETPVAPASSSPKGYNEHFGCTSEKNELKLRASIALANDAAARVEPERPTSVPRRRRTRPRRKRRPR